MRTTDQIVDLLAQRRAARGSVFELARAVSAHYNNRIAIPLPETTVREEPFVPNLIAQGIDQHAMRIASLLPDVDFPAQRKGEKYEKQAQLRRQAAYGWWESNGMDLLLRKRARHLIAYTGSVVEIIPDKTFGAPRWRIHSPLDTYPAPTQDDLDYRPSDVIITYTQPWSWLRRNYPTHAAVVAEALSMHDKPHDDDKIEIARYLDHDSIILVAVGGGEITEMVREAEYGIGDARIINLGQKTGRGQWAITLDVAPQLACCPVITPTRLSLDQPKGQFDDTPGMFQMFARMMSLEVNAVTRAVYPDTWFIKDPQGGGEIIRPADGMRGVVGEVQGGQVINLAMQPGFQTTNVINMLERGLRLNAAMPAELGGESSSNIRTDRRGQSVLSAAIDFHIDEHQKILARSMKAELDVAAEVEAAYWRDQPKSIYVSWTRAKGRADYKPAELWAGDRTAVVSYPFAGMDINQVTVAIGQQVGMQVMSNETAMEKLATVDDPKKEKNRIAQEAIERAVLAGFEQQVAQGIVPLPDAVRALDLLRNQQVDVVEAFNQVQKEAQDRQASSGQPGEPSGPVAPGSPEAQPGIAQPGQGMEQPTAGPQAPQGLMGMRALLNSLTAGKSLTRSG